ncbi:MAG: amino acid-binding protein [Desulfuromonas sp.]|nr:MAG: amino acid-binding protein [Desulfuromonas sp.]
MKVEQISIFIENKTGRLADVSGVLGDAGINIRALSLADTSDFGILRLIVDNTNAALSVLKEKGFTVSKTDVIAVEVPDRPKGLHDILSILDQSEVNVEYMYAFVERSGDNAVIIFRFDDVDAAIKVLQANKVRVIEGRSIYGI